MSHCNVKDHSTEDETNPSYDGASVDVTQERIKELEKSLRAASHVIKKKTAMYKKMKEHIHSCESEIVHLKRELFQKEEGVQKLSSVLCGVEPLSQAERIDTDDSTISIVIPVYNGGDRLKKVLAKLSDQKRMNNMEFVIIDSSSTDNTVDIARSYGAKIVQIPKESFNHGATRQLGVSHASGEYILYTVDDVIPASDYMLHKLVATFKSNPSVSVISLKQMVNKDADLYSRWVNMKTYQSYGLDFDSRYFLENPAAFDYLPDQTKRRLSFIDDVCACYKKDVLMKYGFATIPNAEDVELGRRMAIGGEHLGFLNSTGVFHWHSDPPDYFLKRNYNGVKAFVKILGNNPPDFNTLHICSLDEIVKKGEVLLDTLSFTLDRWCIDKLVDITALKSFLTQYDSTVNDLSEGRIMFSGKGAERAGLKELFLAISGAEDCCNLKEPFRYNHIVANFNEQLKDIFKFYIEHYPSVAVDKDEFADALFKIIAGEIGNTLGYWYMTLVSKGKGDEIEHMDRAMAQGVCFA